MISLIFSMILKNEILVSLISTRDNNIDSLNDLSTSQINVFADGNNSFYRRFKNLFVEKQIQIEPIDYRDIYSEKTLTKILKGTHVLIHVESELKYICMFNYKYPLHLSKSNSYLWPKGFIMKKSIEKTIEDKIKKA